MKTKLLILLFTAMLAANLSACGKDTGTTASNPTPEIKSTSQPTAAAPAGKEYDDPAFNLRYPDNWTMDKKSESGSDVITVTTTEGATLILAAAPVTSNKSAKEFAEEDIAQLKAKSPGIEVQSQKVTISGIEADEYTYSTLMNNVKVVCSKVYIQKDNKYYGFIAVWPEGNQKLQKAIEDMQSSFKFKQ